MNLTNIIYQYLKRSGHRHTVRKLTCFQLGIREKKFYHEILKVIFVILWLSTYHIDTPCLVGHNVAVEL